MARESEHNTVRGLLQPLGGLFQECRLLQTECDLSQIPVAVVQSGDLAKLWPHLKNNRKSGSPLRMSGTGTGARDEDCVVTALAEAIERYCACIYTDDQFIWATAEELGNNALDLDTIPSCSKTELSHPRCPLVAPDKKAPLRWIQAISLLDGRSVYVPAVMVFLSAGFASRAERICIPISTGCASHTSYERALLNGIFEVIERDAISLVWLQKLSLSQIEIDAVPLSLATFWERYERSSRNLKITFFDATTDLGIPTVYGLQVAPGTSLSTMVACSTATDPAVAVAKVIRDMAALRAGFHGQRPVPKSFEDFDKVFHGAIYMATPERVEAFHFLMQPRPYRRLSEISALPAGDDRSELRWILELLRRNGLDVYAIDLTTDEAVRSGVRVVRVLIPALQPLGFHYRARYLGNPRLYDAPAKMGYPVLPEIQLNHWPQPFA